MKNVAIIGAGLQGRRRLGPILEDKDYKVSWVIDIVAERAKNLAKLCGAKSGTSWRDAASDKDVDVVLVLTYPDSHAQISIEAMKKGKDVLCEKPLAKTLDEAKKMIEVSKKTKKILKCGFNHRHHPGVLEAYRLFKDNTIGKAVFGRGTYGIVGRQGLENEWRSDPKIVGGGQLMEQGIHLVDLFCWFLGDMEKVTGFVNTNFWPIRPLEDNGFALMQNKDGVMTSIHSSLTQWINLFVFEIYGEKGSLSIQGLGGSYGVEKLIIGQHEQNKQFSYKTLEFRGSDISWRNEWKEFIRAIKSRKEPMGNGFDGLQAMKIIEAVYKASKTEKTVVLK
ncbi:Gfo/Idh/MocA family oxidoreductase [Candidatus Gottesmanbacteria bacterium]|nr:Gfo/Idh/MocA family oxidoreductase [Candidatus Gottesmanbacteria bacterium]